MKLLRKILFSTVLLIILGHASFAHSHDSNGASMGFAVSIEYNLFEILRVAVASDTGNHHLEDYKVSSVASVIDNVHISSLNLFCESILLMQQVSNITTCCIRLPEGVSPNHLFFSVYTLRGSPLRITYSV